MKKFLVVSFAFIALVLLNPFRGLATHISGVDIAVEYLGVDPNDPTLNQYILTANLFRDCNPTSAGLGTTLSMCRSSTCGDNETYTLTRLPGYPIDVSQVCPDPSFVTECAGGTVPGYELHKYKDTVSFTAPMGTCDRYTFSYQSCCRNTTTNVSGQPGFSSELVYFYNNNPQNNTPQFVATFPFPYVCLQPNQTFSMGALEIDGDSLTYVPGIGTVGAGSCPITHTPIPYVTPFTALNPFNSPIGTNVNLTSGLVTFTPIQVGNYVVVVRVVEADPFTGDTLSYSNRDIQVVVENCNNFAPYDASAGIQNFQGTGTSTGPTSLELCVGETFSFDFIVGDSNNIGVPSNDSLDVFIDSLQLIMPGAILTHTGTTPFDTITLTWMATPGTSPLFGFNMTITDNICPIPGVVNYSFDVRIKPSAFITAEETVCLGDTLKLEGSGGNVISWSILPGGTDLINGVNYFPSNDLSTASVFPDTTTTYVLITDNQSCHATDTFTVFIDTKNPAISLNPLYCYNADPAPILTAATPGGVWTGTGIHPTTGILDMSILDPGPREGEATYEVVYTFESTTGCVSTDTATFLVANYNALMDTLPPFCLGDTSTVNLKDWTYSDFGEFISVPNGSAEFLGPNLTEDGILSLAGLDAGTYAVRHALDTHCATPFDTTLTIHIPPSAKITDFDPIYCTHTVDSVFFGSALTGGYWGGNAIVDPTTGAMIPSKVGSGNYALSYIVMDPETRCKSQDVVNFKISDNPTRPRIHHRGPFCVGDELSDLTADGLRTNNFRWYSDAMGSEDNLLHRGRKINVGELTETDTLYATQTNEDGCESYTASIELEVWPYPTPDFDADIWEGLKLPLEVNFTNLTTDADIFFWDFADGSVFDERDPEAHFFQELGIYNVTLTADNSVCISSITKQVLADAKVVVDVPNVFTPNGDNFNDKWAPEWENIDQVHVTVLNRWGKILYEFESPEDGWDGGNNKDGTYFYIIRGIEHSLTAKPIQYTGDITLIRGE